MNKPKVIAIVGPTAAGKTSLSINIAKQCTGEVISADSRQVYRGLDIGSGKVTAAEMDGVPHHLLDVVEPRIVYTGANFKRDAKQAMTDILSRGHVPIIAGGTFFYVELLRGSMQAAPVEPNPDYRKELEQYSDTELLELLQVKDPVRAESIDPHNRRRLVRALEIINELGQVPAVQKTESEYEWLMLGVDITKEQLHTNIHNRLEERFADGMITEVENLLEEGVPHERLDELGLEYRYISRFLRGELTEEEMKEQLETKIRQFAKRQMTWLKRDSSIIWVDPKDTTKVDKLVAEFLN